MSAKSLLFLFDRPQEPCFMDKGDNHVFVVPDELLTDKVRPNAKEIVSRFGTKPDTIKIPVKPISPPPLDEILELGRNEHFSLFVPFHRKIAGLLIDIYLAAKNLDELLSLGVYTRDRVNPYLFNYAFSVALLHRPDTQDINVPSSFGSFPDKYVDPKVFTLAREEITVVPQESRMPIPITRDYTASDLEEEHRLAYFREDIGINLHHWHWHLVYPNEGPEKAVKKDRRGELFYYMHHQIQARYNCERLANNLKRVERLIDWKSEIEEAYFPKLDSMVASRTYPPREANQKFSTVSRGLERVYADVEDLTRWDRNIFNAINQRSARAEDGKIISLAEPESIDVLGNMVESSILSPDRKFYGDLHNMGHIFISSIHDPDYRHLESLGVMGDTATAMRDPVFYRWHAYIDFIFQKFKENLPKYTVNELNYPGITVEDVTVEGGPKKNVFTTFWQRSHVNISRGLDFQHRGPVYVSFVHLQHLPFTYRITVNNEADGNKEGTCRIFLAPKYDERNNSWSLREQRLMFVELDKFKVTLKQGSNTITRTSSQSSVTIPFERTFRDLDFNKPESEEALNQFNFCGCGWPEHMLIPKGTVGEMQFQLFVMISNYADDKVDQNVEGVCNDADSYCGVKDRLYPDRRAMGYPFDRLPAAENIEQFLTSNMRVQDVIIKHTDQTFKHKQKQ